jgi:hypothetical protein
VPQTPESDDDKPAVTDQEIFLEADERLRISMEADGENRTYGVEDLQFEDGEQWPDDLYNQRKIQRRPTLTINMTRRCVREVCNNMRQQRPRIKVHPTGDGARIEDAKMVNGLIRNIENLSKADYAYDVGGESAVKIGWGYWRILSEYIDEESFEQELKIKAIRNPFTVYDDPTAVLPTGADRDWLIITEEMKRTKYKRLYPKAENSQYERGGAGDVTRLWESKEKIRLAEYFRIARKPDKLYEMTDGSTLFQSDLKRLQGPLAEGGIFIAKNERGEDKSRPSFRRSIEWFRLNGTKIIDRRTLPGQWIPVIRCEGNVLDLNGEIRRRGMVRDLKDVNRMLNYWTTCETELIALAPRAPFIAAEGQLNGHAEWKDANQKPYSSLIYSVVHTNPENPDSPVLPPPMRQEAVQIPAGVVNARQGAMQDLMALAGMPHEPRADLPGSVVSGRALRERQAQSDRSHFQYYDNQTQAIAHTGEILLDLIPHYYSTSRMQRIIGEDGVPQMVQINERTQGQDGVIEIKNNLQMGRYDVVMDTGPGYETKRQEGQEAVIDLLKTPLAEPIVKVGADLIVRNMDFAGADDLADRLLPTNPQGMQKALQQLPKEAQGIVQALMQQSQQKDQVIQQLQMELKYKGSIEQMKQEGETKRELMRVHTKAHDTEESNRTKREDTQIRAATQIHDTHVKAVTAHDVAEIQAGAGLIDTKVQAEHEKELAKETAKAAERAEKPNGST